MTLKDLECYFSTLKPFELPYLGTCIIYDMCTYELESVRGL